LWGRPEQFGFDYLNLAADRGPHMLEVGIPAAPMPRVPGCLTEDGVFVGVRGATGLRISPHLYTTDVDLDRLFNALIRALEG
jgi:selenocysteine lyase/cysteine desulfurase